MVPMTFVPDRRNEPLPTTEAAAYRAAAELPRPHPLRLPGMFLRLRRDILGLFTDIIRDFGNASAVPLGRFHYVLFNHPDQIAHVLQRGAKNYCKSASYREFEHLLGMGLVNSEGDLWRRQRRIIQPLFKRGELLRFAPLIADQTRHVLERWRSRDIVDIHEEMTRLTLSIVGLALFNTDLSDATARLSAEIPIAMDLIVHRTEALFNYPMWLPIRSHRRFYRARAVMDQLVADLIAERRQLGADASPHDLLSRLLFARDPEDDGAPAMSAEQVRNEIVTFLVAGHDTTANGLAWTFMLLARHPQVVQRIRDEVATVAGDRPLGAEELAALVYTRQVLLESMRLYPPAWIVEREALVDDVVCGWRVPKGSLILLSSYFVHRNPEFWPDPLRFDPNRFAPEAVKRRHKCAYFPFGAGQRQCIGESFAMMELLQIVPAVVRAVDLAPDPQSPVVPEAGITLRPRDGIRVRIRPWQR